MQWCTGLTTRLITILVAIHLSCEQEQYFEFFDNEQCQTVSTEQTPSIRRQKFTRPATTDIITIDAKEWYAINAHSFKSVGIWYRKYDVLWDPRNVTTEITLVNPVTCHSVVQTVKEVHGSNVDLPEKTVEIYAAGPRSFDKLEIILYSERSNNGSMLSFSKSQANVTPPFEMQSFIFNGNCSWTAYNETNYRGRYDKFLEVDRGAYFASEKRMSQGNTDPFTVRSLKRCALFRPTPVPLYIPPKDSAVELTIQGEIISLALALLLIFNKS